ncbi:MAG: hypothetical protein ACLF0P_08100 [Thermoanaerobaculia bacterium]
MWNVTRKSYLGRFLALGGRTWTVFLVVLGLAPATPARNGPQQAPVPERIERIRAALNEQGPDALGSAAALAPTGLQEGEEEGEEEEGEEEKKPPDWDDWNNWNDWADF